MPSVCLSNGQEASFVVRRSSRSRQITLRLYADGVLRVAAPKRASDAAVKRFIVDSSDWILAATRKQCTKKAAEAPTVSYADNSLHYYRGERIRLCWNSDSASASLTDGVLLLNAQSEAGAGLALRAWYQKQAESVFSRRLNYWVGRVDWLKHQPPIRIKPMSSRWGSCSHKGQISLNLHLIKAPEFVLDEVLVHEICHLREMNHGAGFYFLLDDILPNWRQSRAWIKENNRQLLADHSLWK